jgi:hypothetical protein
MGAGIVVQEEHGHVVVGRPALHGGAGRCPDPPPTMAEGLADLLSSVPQE